ncbi:MAG TPA: AI-2E family transporter [Geminicoccaceae bacterium]|nr:AI-2E family transporter [Geminicoccaceae bacterium]
MESENRIERAVGLVMLAILAVGCLLVLRPFFTAVCFALILVIATWPAFDRLQDMLGGRRALAALLMVTLATLVFVLPPALVASRMDYNVAGTIQLLRDLSQHGVPPPPDWVEEIDVIGPEIHDRWQALAEEGGSEAAERVQAYVAWTRKQLIGAGLSLGNAVVQLILAMLTAFFLYRDGVAVRRSLTAAGRRIAGDHAPRLIRVASATINGVVYGVLGTALVQALLLLFGLGLTGIPAALLLGLLLFLLCLIPFGPLLIVAPAAVWLYLGGQVGWAVFIVVWSIAAGLVTDNLLKPWLISRGSNLPLILILFGVVGGAVAFGFLGLFLGPTLLAVGYELIREWNAAETPDAQLSG